MHHDSQLAKQAQHYSDVRARLMNPKNAVRPGVVNISTEHHKQVNELRRQLEAMTAELNGRKAETEKQIQAKQEVIDHLLLDLADAHARILSQAEKLSVYGEAEVIGEGVKEYRRPVKDIIAEVLRDFPDVTWAEVQGIRRTRHLIPPRQRCMYEVYKQRPDLSLPAVGKIFGGRDHTTILHAVHKVKAERDRDAA